MHKASSYTLWRQVVNGQRNGRERVLYFLLRETHTHTHRVRNKKKKKVYIDVKDTHGSHGKPFLFSGPLSHRFGFYMIHM